MSNNIYDILKKLENLEAPRQNLTEGKKVKPDYIDIDKDGDKKESMKKAAKEKDKGGIAEAVARVEKNLAEKYTGYKKRLGEESGMKKSVIPVGVIDGPGGYEEAQKRIQDYKASEVKRQELPPKELPPIEDRSKPAEKPTTKAVDESGLMYHTGVKKHGKEYMQRAAEAGRKGASQEELGRLKDKYSKAYKKNKKMDEGVLGLASGIVAPAIGAADTVTRARDDDPVGAGMAAASTALGGMGMIPGPQAPLFLGGSFGLDIANLLRDAAKHSGGWKQLGKKILTSPDPDHTFLPEDFDELDLLERSGQLNEEGVWSKLVNQWGPDAVEWLVKKLSKGTASSDDLASSIARSAEEKAPKVNYDLPPGVRKEIAKKEKEAARLSGNGPEKKSYSEPAVDLEKEFANREAGRVAAAEREAAEREAAKQASAEELAKRAEQAAERAEKAAETNRPSVFEPEKSKEPSFMKKVAKGVGKAAFFPAATLTAADIAARKLIGGETLGSAVGSTVRDWGNLLSAAAKESPQFVSDIFRSATQDKQPPPKLPEPNRPYDPSKPSEKPSNPPRKQPSQTDNFNVQGLNLDTDNKEQGVAEGKYNEDMLSPKEKSFAALAEPKDKITYADRIAGAKKKQKDEGNEFSGELVKARAQGKDNFKVDGKSYPVKEVRTSMREGWEEMQKYLEKKRGPESKGGAGKKAGTRYGGSAQKDDDEEMDGEGQAVVKKKGRPKGTGGGAKFNFKKPKD